MACQSHLEGNVFFNGPRGSININDGFGGGNLITRNVLFNFLRGSYQSGCFFILYDCPHLNLCCLWFEMCLKGIGEGGRVVRYGLLWKIYENIKAQDR